MSGKDLKEKLKAAGINLSELAKRMGYKTDQNLHSVLGAKEMNSSVIERMAEALGKPIGWFYDGGESIPAPATELLLRGVPICSGQIRGELCTPTGAALMTPFSFRQYDTIAVLFKCLLLKKIRN